MIRERDTFERRLAIGVDAVLISLAYALAFVLRLALAGYSLNGVLDPGIAPDPDFHPDRTLAQIWMAVPVWSLTLYFVGMYREMRSRSLLEAAWCLFKSALYSVLLMAGLMFVLKLEHPSRLFLLLFVLLATGMIFIKRWALICYMDRQRRRGAAFKNLLIIGSGRRAERFIELVRSNREWVMRVIGLLDYESDRVGQMIGGIRVIGVLQDLENVLRSNVVDEVIFIVPRDKIPDMEPYLLQCVTEGIRTHLTIDLFNLGLVRSRTTDFEGIPLLTYETTPSDELRLSIKRAADLGLSFCGLAAFSPLLALIGLAIRLDSPGPALFVQERVGLGGRRFRMLKFRTMCVGAEERRDELQALNEMNGPVFKIADDPRVTRVGRWLRRSSLDELPQLFNVLVGHMSLVGPRPPIPAEVDKYEFWQRRRLSMRPGLSCLWQIRGRNRITDFDEWMRMDLEYIDNWSLRLDFIILAQTLPAILRGDGAR